MANEEQVALLRQGSQIWNNWRSRHKDTPIDLSYANLAFTDLSATNLNDADLSVANLHGANLRNADLRNANLKSARLHFTNFQLAKLHFADLSFTHLSNATFQTADLTGVNLTEARVGSADFSFTDLYAARLSLADFRTTNFSNANLRATTICYANISYANFKNANLSDANLMASQAQYTNFERTTFTGACVQDCTIGNSTVLREIRCDYIFRTCQKGTFTDRLPMNPESSFAPGEFEKWLEVRKGALDTIDITFTGGIDWQELFHSLQRVRGRHPEAHITIRSMEEVNGIFVVRFKVESELTGDAQQQLNADVESQLKLQLAEARGEIRALERSLDNTLEKLSMASKNTVIHGGGNILIDDNYGNITARIHNHYGQNAETIIQKLEALREYAQSFPEAEKGVAQDYVEDLSRDLQQTEKPNTDKLKRRLIGLLGIALALGTHMATATDFANNVLELADKLAVPTDALQPQLQQLKAIYPEFDWPQPE